MYCAMERKIVKDSYDSFLGIYIPTYNRGKLLEENLSTILPQFQEYNFPVFVLDDSSQDDTEEMVRNFEKRFNNIFYIRNASNSGLYLNILKCLAMANTKYLWLMGDDDAISKGSLETIIPVLRKGYDYAVLNSIALDKDLKEVRLNKIIKCKTDRIYPAGMSPKLLVDLKKWTYHGFISSMIFKKELITALIAKYEDKHFILYGNIWFPTALFYEAISNKTGIFLCEPVVLNRNNPYLSAKGLWDYAFLDHVKAVAYLSDKGYELKALKKASKISFLNSLILSVVSKSLNPTDHIFSGPIKSNNLISFTTKSVALMIDCAPGYLIRYANRIISRLKNITDR